MSGWAAAAQVAAEMADKFIDSRSGGGAAAQSRKGRQFTLDMYRRQLIDRREDRHHQEQFALRNIVEGAERAGIHPLFALGQGGSGGQTNISLPGGSAGGQSSRGSLGRAVSNITAQSRDTQLDKMAAEAHAIRMEREKIQLKRDEVALMAESNHSMRLQQELLRNPTAARAFSIAAAKADRVGALNRDLGDRLAVTTPTGATFTGPYGGKWEIPPGITPQETWDMLLGETGELAGIGIGARMALGQDKMEKARKAHNRAVKKKRDNLRRQGAKKIQKQIRRSPRRNW